MGHRKITWLLFLSLLLLAGFFGFIENIYAEKNSVVINEVMYDPGNSDDGKEWIELYNPSGSAISLSGWTLKVRGPSKFNYLFGNFFLESKHFIVIHFKKTGIDNDLDIYFACESCSSSDNMGDSYGSTSLFDEELKIVNFVQYGKGRQTFESAAAAAMLWKKGFFAPDVSEGMSLELIKDGDDNNLPVDWQESFCEEGTPGKRNSIASDCPIELPPPPEETQSEISSDKIRINEIFPAPNTKNQIREFVEFYNSDDKLKNLKEWKLKDNNLKDKENKYCVLPEFKIESGKYKVFYLKDCKSNSISLNNSGDSLRLYDPLGKEVHYKIEYVDAKTDVSYNFDGVSWRWSKFLTPGKENKFNNLPEVSKKKDQKIYAGVYADFSAKGRDKDKDKLKFTWDFGDGHKSYKKETRHKYKKAGKYKVTLKVSDGSEDKIETFSVKVEKFPKSKVKILSVSANPKGRDSDAEFITLLNKSKKKINLKDWSVATGSKNLYNHPVSQDIFIKPGETLKLTRAFSKFALNNTKAKVELRYPNGKVASKLAYDKKTKSIAEDEIYTKESGRWVWVAPKAETKLASAEIQKNNVGADLASVQEQIQTVKEETSEKNIILADSQNFSQDETLLKNSLEKFTRPQGIVLGAATFRPTFSGTYPPRNKNSYMEIVFSKLNFFANYFLNKLSFFFN